MLASTAFIGIVFGSNRPLLAIGVAVVALVAPPLVAFLGFPTRDHARIEPDGIVFARRAAVRFAEITQWGTDDYLKLVRRDAPTVLVSALDGPGRDRLLAEFQAAFGTWQARRPVVERAAVRTHFYGGARGRLVGLLILALGITCMVMALRLREPNVALAFTGGLGGLFGLVMLLGRRG
ncbi:hypothetical protein MNO14_04655 [Luteimonas sp. S4-F44]|uniref:hypothetical protein n=1 Tax=Luteimonas sp. S4-F44 TaxID=2925842 RepID=UPI001F535743|nr:hypothetical protein [Luteimonas sp. S4-F44]UNK43380.1 hypothetical protein MNO14_04655 [Luteimonas sp. S4-F44]